MDVERLLNEVGSSPAPPSRLVAAELYAAGRQRADRRRFGLRAFLAGLAATVAVGGAGATAYALTGGFAPDGPAPVAVVDTPWSSGAPETSASPSARATAAPATTRPTPARSTAPPAWDCAAAGRAATAVLAQHGGTEAVVTCAHGTLKVVATTGRSGPTKVTITVEVRAGVACVAGQSVRCEDTALGPLGVWGAAMPEVRLGRPDGTVIAVSTQVEGLWSGPVPVSTPEQLRGVALALAGKI
ncbi:hypothetical protein AB0M43_12285 [Longispora sp. NPDC051575]|uniref:hypothetical protein n=1 Tax=Longispora sp. NPDC051575 TaxID=3154943 RepID=UPI003440EE23